MVITLYAFGPFLGTPDSSPFVIKTMVLLKLAQIPYRVELGNPFTAPHRFLPYVKDDGVTIGDSTLIRWHLEGKYRADFDAGLSSEQRASAWAIERLCEDHLYFAMLHSRWVDRDNFRLGLGRHMFNRIPMPLRPLVKAMLRHSNRRRLHGHGLGRLEPGEIAGLACSDINALATLLGDKPFIAGVDPCGADATVFGLVTSILTPPVESPLRAALQSRANLVDYRDRMTARFFAG